MTRMRERAARIPGAMGAPPLPWGWKCWGPYWALLHGVYCASAYVH